MVAKAQELLADASTSQENAKAAAELTQNAKNALSEIEVQAQKCGTDSQQAVANLRSVLDSITTQLAAITQQEPAA